MAKRRQEVLFSSVTSPFGLHGILSNCNEYFMVIVFLFQTGMALTYDPAAMQNG